MGRLRRRVPHGSLNYLYGAFLLGFLWPIILICLVHSAPLAYIGVLPCVCMHLLAKMDFTEKAYGQNIPWHQPPSDLQGAFLHMCDQGDLLTWRMRNMWSEPCPAAFLDCTAILSWSFSPQGMNLQLLYPGGVGGVIYLLPQTHCQVVLFNLLRSPCITILCILKYFDNSMSTDFFCKPMHFILCT